MYNIYSKLHIDTHSLSLSFPPLIIPHSFVFVSMETYRTRPKPKKVLLTPFLYCSL